MTISPERKAKLLEATREAAAAFVEDMAYIRETLARADRTTPGELRRLSAILRRLLIEDDLRSIAPPRIGSFSLLVPDNDAIYRAARKQSVRLFESGGINVFNNEIRAVVTGMRGAIALDPAFDKHKTIAVSQDSFLNQKVLGSQ